MQGILSNMNLYLPLVLNNFPYVIILIQFIALVILYVNTHRIKKDKNAREYYELNLTASVLFSLPLLLFGLIQLFVYVNFIYNPANFMSTALSINSGGNQLMKGLFL
jgi:hypothetical protein